MAWPPQTRQHYIGLGVLKLVAGAATSIATTYPELPPLSSDHMVAVNLDFYQLQHRRTTKVPALVTPLAPSPIVLGMGNHWHNSWLVNPYSHLMVYSVRLLIPEGSNLGP